MRTLIGIVVIGALAGLVLHALYVMKWSGSEIAALDLTASGETIAMPIDLTPDMNPVRALLDVDYETRRERLFDYDIAIVGEGISGVDTVFRKSGVARTDLDNDNGISGRRRGGLSVNAGTFTVPAGGDYVIRSRLSPQATVDIDSARLLLRANTASFNYWLIGGLSAVILLGFILGGRRQR